jgi:hypothetical protein
MIVSPPTSIMLAGPWNTIAKRNILINLIKLLLQEMDGETRAIQTIWMII